MLKPRGYDVVDGARQDIAGPALLGVLLKDLLVFALDTLGAFYLDEYGVPIVHQQKIRHSRRRVWGRPECLSLWIKNTKVIETDDKTFLHAEIENNLALNICLFNWSE